MVDIRAIRARGLVVSDALLSPRFLLGQVTDCMRVHLREGRGREVLDVAVISSCGL